MAGLSICAETQDRPVGGFLCRPVWGPNSYHLFLDRSCFSLSFKPPVLASLSLFLPSPPLRHCCPLPSHQPLACSPSATPWHVPAPSLIPPCMPPRVGTLGSSATQCLCPPRQPYLVPWLTQGFIALRRHSVGGLSFPEGHCGRCVLASSPPLWRTGRIPPILGPLVSLGLWLQTSPALPA